MVDRLHSKMETEEPDELYRATFESLSRGRFTLRRVELADRDFLYALFRAVQVEAIGRAGGDPALLAQAGPLCALQFASQSRAYESVYPRAAHYLALSSRSAAPVGRIMIEWSNGEEPVTGVDVSILPTARAGAVGLHLLQAWVRTCDLLERSARLTVMPDNPARTIYRRLGFIEADGAAFPVAMTRPPHA